MRQRKFWMGLLTGWITFSLVGCGAFSPFSATSTSTPTSIPATHTFTPEPSLTPTPTPSPTFTATPTLTPTPRLWALAGTPLPEELQSIRLENAAQISGLAEWQETSVSVLAWMPPDYRLLTVVTGPGIKFYDIASRQLLRELYPQGQPVVDVVFNPSGHWLVSASRRGSETASYQSSLEIWAGPDWKPLGLLYDAPRAISDLVFSPNGKNMAAAFTSPVAEQNSVEIWSTTGWVITGTVTTGITDQAAFAPGSQLLAVSPDRYAIRVWNIEEETWQYTLHTSFTGAVTRIVFSPDGGVLASAHYDGFVRLWDMRTGDLYLEFDTGAVVESMALSSDGRLLATGGSFQNNLVQVWDAGNGQLLRQLDGHTSGVTHLLFSPDLRYLVSASYDGWVHVWGLRP